MFKIELMPALYGDCILVLYGTPRDQKRILIDGGPIGSYPSLISRLEQFPPGDRQVELMVVSHVDADHIEGAVRLLAEKSDQFFFDDVWFNGWKHLDDQKGVLGPVQGEFLSVLIGKKVGDDHWNKAAPFNRQTIKAGAGELPQADVAGMELTILSPTPKKLSSLRSTWKKKVEEKDFEPGDLKEALELLKKNKSLCPKGLLGGSYQYDGMSFDMDSSVANGSSIAFLAQYGRKRCLFLADAHPDVVAASLKKLIPPGEEKLKVDAVKLAHHGSKANTTPELLDLIDCKAFLVSTNGDRFDHPDPEAIDMIIDQAGPGVKLIFNYRSDTTLPWSDRADQKKRKYRATYPKKGSPDQGITVNL